jgi:creatinine amidohydrolase/Fe(II)-dependent formamide hydrolase-like protein
VWGPEADPFFVVIVHHGQKVVTLRDVAAPALHELGKERIKVGCNKRKVELAQVSYLTSKCFGV